jgi:hypothetical protein
MSVLPVGHGEPDRMDSLVGQFLYHNMICNEIRYLQSFKELNPAPALITMTYRFIHFERRTQVFTR